MLNYWLEKLCSYKEHEEVAATKSEWTYPESNKSIFILGSLRSHTTFVLIRQFKLVFVTLDAVIEKRKSLKSKDLLVFCK